MTDMFAQLTNLVPVNNITFLDVEVGKELTRPWVFTCNGPVNISTFLGNAGLQNDGTIDVGGVAMPWDFELAYAEGPTPIAQIYKFSWHMQLDSVTVQPMSQFRKMRRAVGGEMIITLEEYVISDVIMLQRAAGGPNSPSSYLSIAGRAINGGAALVPPKYNFNITLHESVLAATA